MTISEGSVTTILVAVIGGLAVVFAAALPLLISTHRRAREAAHDAAVTRDQVTNDHPTNMRVEADERHADVMRLLRSHGRTLGRYGRRIDAVMKRLEIVEDTLPTHPHRRTPK